MGSNAILRREIREREEPRCYSSAIGEYNVIRLTNFVKNKSLM